MGQYKVADHKAQSVDTESVYHNHRCVKYLRRSIYGYNKKYKCQKICFTTDIIESVFFNPSDQYQYQAEEPKHLNVPQRA